MRIQLPPLAEQQAIVAAIESRLSVADQLEATLAQSLQQAEALRQSVLKQAFEGRLV
jgi:type I restriction enzyme S subunit